MKTIDFAQKYLFDLLGIDKRTGFKINKDSIMAEQV
jgi:hypothetical protein